MLGFFNGLMQLDSFQTFPLPWPAQIAGVALAFFVIWLFYRRWDYMRGPNRNRRGDYVFSVPHQRTKGKAIMYEIDPRADPDFIADLRKMMERRLREDDDESADEIANRIGSGDMPALPGPSATTQIQTTRDNGKITKHTLADALEKNTHLRFYLGKCLPTEGANVHGWVLFCTPIKVDHSEYFWNLREDNNPFKGYQTAVREIFTSPDGFVIRNPGYKYHGYPLSAFIYFELTKIADGTVANKEKFQTLQVSMSLMTQLEVTLKAWSVSKFNERFAREMARAYTRAQRFILILSNRNAELIQAVSTESYDERNIRKVSQGLNAFIAAGIMFVAGVVGPAIFRRNIEGPYTEEAFELLGLAIGFAIVMGAYWWKKSRTT